ncbi:hypothetical protein F4604DRAFT_133225 [Suillus subluteus]|nr:hypothetical protein F4604DRAFT_133225 [Suillus subluteus]
MFMTLRRTHSKCMFWPVVLLAELGSFAKRVRAVEMVWQNWLCLAHGRTHPKGTRRQNLVELQGIGDSSLPEI